MEFTYTADHIEVDFCTNPVSVVPDFVVSQLSGGRISRKPLTVSKINELHQDHVCSCLLRIAREIYAHLPVSQVVVHALTDQVNPATGLAERHIILSAVMPRTILAGLNFAALDPSDALKNFDHNMKFTRTGGFQPVERLGLAAPLPRKRR
jgi:hypothetical protein